MIHKRGNFLHSLGILMLGAAILTNLSSCDVANNSDDTQLNRPVKVTMTVGNNPANVSGTQTNQLQVELTEVKLVVHRLTLRAVSEDSADLEVNNLIVFLPLDGDTLVLTDSEIPPGSYDQMLIEIGCGEVDDPDLNTGTQLFSIIAKGTFEGEEFTFRSQRDFSETVDFDPPLEVTETTTAVNLNIAIDVNSWFEGADPTDPADQDLINDNIAASLDAAPLP